MKKLFLSTIFFLVPVFMVFSQDVTLSSQDEIDAFNTIIIDGTLTIEGEDIVDLSPLNSLRKIGEGLVIQNCPFLIEINGFENLDSIGANGLNSFPVEILMRHFGIRVENNSSLNLISDFPELKFVGGIEITNNDKLQDVLLETPQLEIWGFECCNSSPSGYFGDEILVSNNDVLKSLSAGKINTGGIRCVNNPELASISLTEVDSRLRRLTLVDVPNLTDFQSQSTTTRLHELQIVNTGLESISQYDSLQVIGGWWYGSNLISNNKFLRDLTFQNVEDAIITIENNEVLEKISIPRMTCVNSRFPDVYFGEMSINNNATLDSIFIGTECTSNVCDNATAVIIADNSQLRYIDYLLYLVNPGQVYFTPTYSITNNPLLNSLTIGLNADGEVTDSPLLDNMEFHASLSNYEYSWTDAPDELMLDCTEEIDNNVNSWLELHRLNFECTELQPEDDWNFASDYDGAGTYEIDIYSAFGSGDTIRKTLTLNVLDFATLMITSEATDLIVQNNDPDLESTIQSWLDLNGGADAIDICGSFTWCHDYTFDNSPGEYPVTFLVKSDNGAISETTATLIIELSSSTSDVDADHNIILAPNPVVDVLRLSNLGDYQQWNLYSVSGEMQLLGSIEQAVLTIDVQDLNQGVYYIELLTADGERAVLDFVKL